MWYSRLHDSRASSYHTADLEDCDNVSIAAITFEMFYIHFIAIQSSSLWFAVAVPSPDVELANFFKFGDGVGLAKVERRGR